MTPCGKCRATVRHLQVGLYPVNLEQAQLSCHNCTVRRWWRSLGAEGRREPRERIQRRSAYSPYSRAVRDLR